MSNVVCLRHSDYDGSNPPILSCKPCCAIYISFIKLTQEQNQIDPEEWVESKKKVRHSKARASSDKK